ncbi:MAG TPA: hypothetical protein VGI25_09620, partial [Candidatus Udaeobacter sp.]
MPDTARSKCARARPVRAGLASGTPQTGDHAAPDIEDRLVTFLKSPESYPHKPAAVRTIQTHISWVFIASPFVFKVK